ncbi:MAG: 1-deoxy-D-xylulose-5-phosphate reductoisomerase [Kiritimatiellae bacterium]|nr:1-deoxy-D-xylulose-5-phosphate reductoisomerase [Kiritimatiellia bacterium]MDD5521385.1 1-deoxy-D-xylulose-5-phosphate reductoisomerase [Kiritimatiellia bacterium]
MKNIVILGSTGSIGKNALRVIESLPSKFKVIGLAVSQNYSAVLKQAEQFNVRHIAVADPSEAKACALKAPSGIMVHHGPSGVNELASLADADIVLCAVVGLSGLKPVMAAIRNGTDIALATKEVLVAAGDVVTKACAKSGSLLLPVDSEHSAIFQCLSAKGIKKGSNIQHSELNRKKNHDYGRRIDGSGVRKILLTASGGPFVEKAVDFNKVTVRQALAHPTWDMGKKVTIDSATLMNKGLEIMEAHWLFSVPVDRIEVLVHPESIVHSMVEFNDGVVVAQMSVPDMRYAIQYALTYPERLDTGLPPLNLAKTEKLTFMEPDEARFPCLLLAREAAKRGGTMPAVLNAANEIAVQKFLKKEIRFSGIWRLVEKVMRKHRIIKDPDLDTVIDADTWARRTAKESS